MRLVFAGTPAFSVPALEALLAAGHEVCAVYTQPDRPAGRGRKLSASPVAVCAENHGIAVHKPEKLRGNDAALAQLSALAPDAMVVVAYGLILPQTVLDIPRYGCLNIHASLLPRWRGAAPIQRAILAGDRETGVTIMRMEAGLDTGPMLLHAATAIAPADTAGALHDRLAALGAELIVEALDRIAQGSATETPQPETGVSYAAKLDKDEARLDWRCGAAELVRRIHGYNPAPGAWSLLGDERLKLLRAEAVTSAAINAEPGRILRLDGNGMEVASGDGTIRVTELQRPGARPAAPLAAFGGKSPSGARLA